MRFITVTIDCVKCNTKIFSDSIIFNYEDHLSTKDIDKEVNKKTPKKIICKNCNNTDNQKGYSFYHTHKINN